MTRGALGGFVAVTLLLLTGCGGPSGSTAPTGTDVVLPTLDTSSVHQFPSLEARIPRNVGGVELDTASYAFEAGEAPADVPLVAAVVASGRSASDLQIAAAGTSDPSVDLGVLAFRVDGLGGTDLAAMVQAGVEAPSPTTLAGRSVIELTDAGETSYLYVAGDTAYVVSGSPDLVEAMIAGLPG